MSDTTTASADSGVDAYWEDAFSWREYLEEEVEEHRELWEGTFRRAETPAWALERIRRIGGDWKLLAISEDWCGDASNILPWIARFAEDASGVELRVVKRDENLGLMDRYLTNGSRSIPIVVILDAGGAPVGRWGPRPAELQELVLREKRAGERPAHEIYRDARRWYARDRGETTLRELLDRIEEAADGSG